MELPDKRPQIISVDVKTEEKGEDASVKIKNMCCSYTGSQDELLLHNINIDRSKRGLNVIIGPSGSG